MKALFPLLLLTGLLLAACDKPEAEPPATPTPMPAGQAQRSPANDPKSWMNRPTTLDRPGEKRTSGSALDEPAFRDRDGHGKH